MRRLVGALVCAFVVAGLVAATAGAATYTQNSDCLACHDVATGVGAVSRVDFDVPAVPRTGGVDLTRCVSCHMNLPDLVRYGSTFVPNHYHSPMLCDGCHDGVEAGPLPGDTSLRRDLVRTPFGYFFSTASLSLPPDVLHSIHTGGGWVDVSQKSYGCSRCHGTAACNACHDAPVNGPGHQAHGVSSYPAPLADQANGLTVTRQPLSCVQANCHSLAKAGSAAFNRPGCGDSCHADKTEPHGYDLADHVADDGGTQGVACSSCHSLDLDTVHGGGACATCHPSPRDTVGAWDQSCVTGGCHTAGSAAPFHEGASSGHAVTPSGSECVTCHTGADLTAIHVGATDAQGNTSCLVCHRPGNAPQSGDCASCHFPMSEHPQGTHSAPNSASCGGAGCHEVDDVVGNHRGTTTAETCSICHANPDIPVLPADSECLSCHVGSADRPHYDDHWAMPRLIESGSPRYAFYTGSVAGGVFTSACATCHTSNLVDAHLGSSVTPAQRDRFGAPLTCASCHGSPDPRVVLAIAGGRTACEACHTNPMTGGEGVHGPINRTHTSTFKGDPEVPCSPCHSANVIDQHNGTRSWPDANGVQLAYCDVCHENYAGSRGQQVQDAIEVTNDVRCTACHSSAHPDRGGHFAASVASRECGACHAADAASIDVRDVHGSCATCHENPARVGDITAKSAECASCHTPGQFHSGLPAKHTYSGMPSTCMGSSCHMTNTLPEAHEPYMDRFPAYQTTCALCHANTDPGRVPIDATAACDSCHGPAHPDMDHEADASSGCTDCHGSSDVLVLHRRDGEPQCGWCHNGSSLPGSVECANCHSDDPHPAHAFTSASDYNVSAKSGCTNSGSGCHGSDVDYDALAYHSDCGGCHSSPSYEGYAAPDFDCSRCHDGSYMGASSTIPLAGDSPAGHYGVQTHTATQMTRVVGAGGTTKAECSVCHDASLRPAHGSMSASYYGSSLVCYDCHNDARSNGNAQVLANWSTDRCDDCHTTGTKIMHSTTSAPPVAGSTTASCTQAGCHANELHALHKNASSCALAGCHDVRNVKPTKKSCGSGGACHAGATGDHESEHDTMGVIDSGCYGCHFRHLTTEHAALGFTCSTCHQSTKPAVQQAIANGDRRCLTCHPDSAHNQRQAMEFAPGNASMHRVRADLPGMRSSFLVNGVTYTWTLPAASSFLRTGFGYDTVVPCDSCHTYSGSSGPHGATMKVNIDPAYPNPYRVVTGSETFTAQLSANSPTGMSMTKNGSTRANIICEKCHVLRTASGTWSNVAHKEHDDRGREGSYCNQCHVAVPHGWGRPRLIGYVSDPAPYRTWVGTSGSRDGGLSRISLKSYTPSNWQKGDCGAGCSSTRHPQTGTSWPNVMGGSTVPTTGTLTGRVTDSVTGAAVVGATVTLSGGRTATTDGSGMYTIANLAPGSFTVTVTMSGYNTWSGSASITAGNTTTLNVSLVPIPTATNWARTGTATASSTSSGSSPSNAIDGSTSTFWQSSSGGTQWLTVDLGSSRSVSKVVVNWNGSNFAKAYRIETSTNGSTWTSRFSTTSGTSGTKTHTFSAVDVRYVRLYCTSANSGSYRVNEFEVWNF